MSTQIRFNWQNNNQNTFNSALTGKITIKRQSICFNWQTNNQNTVNSALTGKITIKTQSILL